MKEYYKEFSNCYCFNLRKSARMLTKVYDEILKPTKLRSTQFSILAHVYSNKSLTITVLAEQLVMDRTTLTRNLKPLMRDGLIKVFAGKDQRSKNIALTTKGKKKFTKAISLWEKAQEKLIVSLDNKITSRILNDLSKIRKIAKTI